MAREKAKSEMHFSTNKSVIEKYEQRQSEIKTTRAKMESKKKRLAKLMSDIEAIRGPWYESVTVLIEKISKGFSESFGKIGCAGEVRLGEHEDYDKWCIEIMVKFRYVSAYDTLVPDVEKYSDSKKRNHPHSRYL